MTTTTTEAVVGLPEITPRWVLLSEEARVRGFRNALAFKRWCVKQRVALKLDGRRLWVSPVEVDRAVESLPARAGGEPSAVTTPEGR